MKPANLRLIVCLFVLIALSGCPAPTPGERMEQLGAVVTEKGDGVVDLDLSGTAMTDSDIGYIGGFCSNSGKYTSLHTLDLSDTAVTDAAMDHILLQGQFPAGGMNVFVIRNTQISDRAVKKFQEKYPAVEVVR